jgi:hypothetical protein
MAQGHISLSISGEKFSLPLSNAPLGATIATEREVGHPVYRGVVISPISITSALTIKLFPF